MTLLTNNHLQLIRQHHLRRIITCVIIMLLNCYSASADDNKFSLGLSISKDSIDDLPSSYIDKGLKLDFGYTLNRVFSLELSYYKIGDINSPKPVIPSDGIFTATTKVNALDLSVLANHQWDRFSIYAKLGVFYSDLTSKAYMLNNKIGEFSNSGSNLSLGIGAGYKINNNFKFVLDYTDSDSSDPANTSIAITSLGLKYTF